MEKEDEYKFKFSVVIPIYNVEKYLEETIESVINQDIGFKENIQMILVNDGSPDNCEEICLKYKEIYPDNIVYIKQENAGVSAARNNGTQYVQGKYINYLDSDDKWDLDVFSKAYEMFEKHDNIDVVGVRIKFFEANDNFHPLDYKFYKDRTVDIFEKYDFIQLSSSSSFIRATAMEDKEFDTRIKFSEDAKLLYEIILEKERYGLIGSSLYYYRKRYENNSAIQSSNENISWYFDTTKLSYMYLINLSKQKYGVVLRYIQYYIMYDFQWRLMQKISDILDEQQREQYISIIKELLQNIDDEIILMQRNLWMEKKVYLLSLKHNRDIRKEFKYDKGKILYKNKEIYNIKNKKFLEVDILEVEKGKLNIEGKIKDFYPSEDYEIYAEDNKGNRFELEYYDMSFNNLYSFNDDCYFKGIGFKITIPLNKIKKTRKIKIIMRYKSYYAKRLYMSFKKLSGLNDNIPEMYVIKNKYIIRAINNKIFITPNTKEKHKKLEKEYIKYLRKKNKFNIILYRILYFILKKIIKKPIWLVSDRTHRANDNGMHLFKYLVKNEKKAKVYFVISKNTQDYKEMKKIGNVIAYGSIKYKLYFLLASKIISSQADDWVINAFESEETYLRDLYKFKFVFLQHGITKDNLSSWLNKYNKNIAMFVTSAIREYESILGEDYLYTKEQVKLTGFPRYDNLKNNSKKQIVFMPTWRKSLTNDMKVKGTSLREYSENFKNSEYCKFYNNLINDKRIIETLKKKGYKAKFCIHPSFEQQFIDFESNDLVEVSTEIADYQKEFAENSLLITDFSSVAFDFAYLRKPILYTQFDKDTFFEGHLYDKGYFDYEEDGFGPVCYDYETSVNEIIKAIENDCKLDKKYEERINDFYAYNDKNNCKRVHEEILKLD